MSKKYEPCLDCNVPMVSQNAWRKIDAAVREVHLAVGDLNAHGGLGKCKRCLAGNKKPKEEPKHIRWPEAAIELTGGRWVTHRGIQRWVTDV